MGAPSFFRPSACFNLDEGLGGSPPRSRARFDHAKSSGCPKAMSAHGLRRKVERQGELPRKGRSHT